MRDHGWAAGDAQREWFAELQAVNARFLIPSVAAALVAIPLGVGLVVGGIGLLQPNKKWSRIWLRRIFAVLIVFEVLRQILFVVVQVALFPVMQRQFEAMAPAGGGNPAMDPEIFQSMQTVFMIVGYAFWLLWFLTKLVAYIWGRRYLNRDNVKAWCGEATG